MSELKVKPIIIGLSKNIELDLGDYKRPCAYGKVTFICPECQSEQFQDLTDGDTLEYGNFFGFDECANCGVDFENQQFRVVATVKIEVV